MATARIQKSNFVTADQVKGTLTLIWVTGGIYDFQNFEKV
jgi:hypothetical protein